MGKISKQRILKRRISNGQDILKELYNILIYQGKANNNSEIPSYYSQNDLNQKQ